MMRSVRLSRPVVSVSKMISRTSALLVRLARSEGGDDRRDLYSGRTDTVAGIDHKIRPCPFVRIRQLARKNQIEFLLRHARPRKHPLPLNLWITADDGNEIDAIGAGRFEQQRNIEDDDVGTGV